MTQEQWLKIGKGSIIAFAGFASAYIASSIIPQIDQSQTLGMLLVAVFSIVANALKQVASSKPTDEQK